MSKDEFAVSRCTIWATVISETIENIMTDPENPIPEYYVEQVKDTLGNLYNIPELLKTPLISYYDASQGQSSAHQLRRDLMEAIETLNPGKVASIRSTQARLYNLMHLHYVGDMTLQETAHELGISLRQAYRDLKRGQENIASILWFKHNRTTPPLPIPSPSKPDVLDTSELSTIESEIKYLERSFVSVNISDILSQAVKAVQRLADQKNVVLNLNAPDEPVTISTNKAIAQQILINLLSQTIQQTHAQVVQINLRIADENATLQITCESENIISSVIERLIKQVRWSTDIQGDFLTLTLNNHGTRVLIIDDNEGLVDLLHHYISTNVYQVFTAHNGVEGLGIASKIQPDVIIMDLMMPDMDGWELLQYLRTTPETSDIPVVICSVIHDPELAYSLGADEFIAKPVTQEQILTVLKKLNI